MTAEIVDLAAERLKRDPVMELVKRVAPHVDPSDPRVARLRELLALAKPIRR